jgi:hypothetical protein
MKTHTTRGTLLPKLSFKTTLRRQTHPTLNTQELQAIKHN